LTTDQPGRFLDSIGEPLDRMPEEMRPGTNAIIFNDSGELLLERRSDNGFWGLPGGAMEIGESVEQAVKREVFEETGLDVTVGRLVGVYSDPRYYTIMSYPGGDLVHFVTVVFECRQRDGELRISEESTDIGYFDVEALPDNILLSHSVRIRDALENSPVPFIR
jgi:ADP-ribose pyrophosphatase YjhB (NUDIX family)